jgi:cell division septation protein DedD
MRMIEQGSVRNLDQIQEEDAADRMPRAASLTIVALGGACIVFATLALGGRKPAAAAAPIDPLGELVAQRAHAGQAAPPVVKATDLSAQDVTFPSMLSDGKSTTTALAAVRGGPSPVVTTPPPAVLPATPSGLVPPPATDRLSVVNVAPIPAPPPAVAPPAPPPLAAPLPAQSVLEATAVVTRPRDTLTKQATESGQIQVAAPAAVAAGHDGGYQLQVSSFHTQAEANQFSDQLRARGHKAYVVEAHVPGRGTWYRVRVGPFTTQHAAVSYRASFEAKEHVVPFVVPPQAAGHEHEAAH